MLRRFAAFVSKERITMSPERASTFARWKAVPGAVLVQASIGGVYAWSIFNEPLTRNIGVIAASSQDWSLGDVVPIFSCAAVSLGVCSALLGPWAERVGPRAVCLTAAGCWSSGLALAGLGVQLNSLPLVYLGYGVLGGAGWGLGYISPIPALLSWFPDRRGLASGIGLAAFGMGAMLAAPLESWLLSRNFRAPTFLGSADSLSLVTEQGRRFVSENGTLREVLVATIADVARLPVPLSEGVYLLGTGSTGAAATFATLSCGYVLLMSAGALMIRLPPAGHLPAGFVPKGGAGGGPERSVHYATAMKTPQFYLLWATLFGNTFAGVTIISAAKTIMSDVFGGAYPAIVTGAFAAAFVTGLAGANMLGRLTWGPLSDKLGRKVTLRVRKMCF
jgi:MFS family permease